MAECLVDARVQHLEFAEPFVISRGASESLDVIQVRLALGGVVGYGEATPLSRYGETADSAAGFVIEHAPRIGSLVAVDPLALEELRRVLRALPGPVAAKAAVEIAALDLAARLLGVPVHRLLGLPRGGPATAWTVWLGDPDDMARRAEKAAQRFPLLKLKLGGADGLDLERAGAVRSVTDHPLVADVNEGWTLDEAKEGCERLAALGFAYVEQPLAAGLCGAEALKAASPLPVYVDEDCHTLADLTRCAAIAHGINVKLAKAGGVGEAIRMVHAARALGLLTMLGCMGESGLGIAPAAAIAPLFDHVDLDGNLLLRQDPHPVVTLVEGVQLPSSGPGWGELAPW